MAVIDLAFRDKIDKRFDASACMNCGVCTALCPMEIGPLPRQVFRHAILGLTDTLQSESETIFSCLLCRMCEVNCPAQVPIAENMRLLRGYFNVHLDGLGG